MTPDEFYGLLQMSVIVLAFFAILIIFAYIAFEKTEKI